MVAKDTEKIPLANAHSSKQKIYENDRQPDRPSSYSNEFYWMVYQDFLRTRPALNLANQDTFYMQKYILLEMAEALEELDKKNINLEAYVKELIDVLVLLFSLAINNNIVPHFGQVENKINGQAPNETIFLAKMEHLNRPEAIGDVESIEALKAIIEEELIVIGSFINHGPEFPHTHFFLEMMKQVISKITRNCPEIYFQNTHWLTGRKLTLQQALASYHHAKSCLRLIRDKSGNNPTGLNSYLHRPYQYLILDFENADKAYQQLVQELEKPIVSPLVLPNYRSDVYAGLEKVA